jgi:hypothetical protein
MPHASLRKEDIESIASHVREKRITLAVIRTEHAPTELGTLFGPLGSASGLSLMRNIWSPNSDFGFAEFYSNGKMLVLLYIGGPNTELVSVSETDEVFVADLEETVCSSNIQSSSIRDGL